MKAMPSHRLSVKLRFNASRRIRSSQSEICNPAVSEPQTGVFDRIQTVSLWAACCLCLLPAATSSAAIVTFEDLTLPPESYWNGANGSGGFASGDVLFSNYYDAEWEFWDGFAYSNLTETTATDLGGQYGVIAGTGQGGSINYGIAFVGWAAPPTITFTTSATLAGVYVANNTYAYYALLNGSLFSKKFGGAAGTDEDWFKLTITGKDAVGQITGTVDFYLADFRFANSEQDYILDTWAFVSLRPLGEVKSLEFSLASSDTGAFGMNTPAYFCLDSLISDPAPTTPADPGKPFQNDAAINGYVDLRTGNPVAPHDPNATLNPIFRGWAADVAEYAPADDTWSGDWNNPGKALGPVTGDPLDIVSLGELTQTEIDAGKEPGYITMVFGDPNDPNDRRAIRNGKGLDFAIFENAIISQITTANGSVQGQLLAELAYVEVSSNGRDFAWFPSVSLTPGRIGAYGTTDMGNIHNLAGKHPNAGGICTGTPFDLDDLATHPAVLSGQVDPNAIHYIRLVDIPGSGDFFDEAQSHLDPNTWPVWANYAGSHPIFDQWPTWGSGGFDLEAIGVLNEQEYEADINLDGIVDPQDMDLMTAAWNSRFGDSRWIGRCDLAQPKDLFIDSHDLDVLASQWGSVESWRRPFVVEPAAK